MEIARLIDWNHCKCICIISNNPFWKFLQCYNLGLKLATACEAFMYDRSQHDFAITVDDPVQGAACNNLEL
jgi:hypothetical protein